MTWKIEHLFLDKTSVTYRRGPLSSNALWTTQTQSGSDSGHLTGRKPRGFTHEVQSVMQPIWRLGEALYKCGIKEVRRQRKRYCNARKGMASESCLMPLSIISYV